MKLIVINNSDDTFQFVGNAVSIIPGTTDVAVTAWYQLIHDLEFRRNVFNCNLVLNDGIRDYRGQEAIDYLVVIERSNYYNKDSNGSDLSRGKITTTGWHLQMHAVEVNVGTWNGFRNMSIDPTTLVETDHGFVTFKLFDSGRAQITNPLLFATACYTQIDWTTNHEAGIIGAIFTQAGPPASDIYMYTIGAPGIANIRFGTGGINLKCIGIGGVIDADGKAEKYIHPSLPMPGLNKFRTIFKHNAATQHQCQIIYKIFKPV